MTPVFRDLPIPRKLLLMTLLSNACALALAGVGFVAWDAYTLLHDIRGDLATQADIVAGNSDSALEFQDKEDAGRVVGSLDALEHVRFACLYIAPGNRRFASYQRTAADVCPAALPPPRTFGDGVLETSWPVTSKGQRVGSLLIRRDLEDLFDRLRVGATTVLGFLLLAIGASFLISSRIQRVIAAPLLHLAETARQISASRNYALRATPTSNDEVGVVVHAFNDMLDRIGERTTELSRANVELQHEVEERRRMEGERTAALERETNANRLKDEFLATLSHELRTPLNAVLGWTRVLRTAHMDAATQARALESVERNARAQARLIEDLLEISRIVTGKLRLQIEQVDLASIIDAAIDIVQPAATARRLRLTTQIDVRPALTAGDPDRLQQVIWNLLSNAVKFTPPGGDVSIALEQRDGYIITVRDSGPGIDPQFMPFIFEPFRQADGTPSREHGGLGLGLAIARRLVELHGGTIGARRDAASHGAVLEVHLPSQIATPPRRPLATM